MENRINFRNYFLVILILWKMEDAICMLSDWMIQLALVVPVLFRINYSHTLVQNTQVSVI